MKETKSDAIFHPIRFRIVQALFGGRKLTARQLEALIEGASLATLYRHLNRLTQAGVISVVEEIPNRGTLEKVYGLASPEAADIREEEAVAVSREDQLQHFNLLVGSLLNDYGRFIETQPENTINKGVIVRQEAVYVTEDEARQLSKALREALKEFEQMAPEEPRHRHMLTMIMLPVIETTEQEG